MTGALEGGLLAAADYFVHLSLVLVPLFVGASFLVGLVGEYLPPDRIERTFRRYDAGTGNVVAAGVGAVTPFCSCSTVPVLAGLLGAGAPLGMAFSFLLASPLVNELAVVLLVGVFGLKVAALYVAVAFAAAVAGGLVVGRLGLEDHVKDGSVLGSDDRSVATDGGTPGCESSAAGAAGSDACGGSTACGDGSCGSPEPVPDASHRARVRRAASEAREFFVDVLPYLLVGVTVGAIVHGFVPTALLHRVVGPENPLAVPIAAVVGAPMYVSMSAVLPVAATFADQGIPIGTVLAFVVGSAGVSLPNLVLLNKLFDRTLLAAYALTVVATGVTVGVVFNALLA
ncbi:permease [Halobacteriales archaeon QS_8_69_26]|nr:MAG: permease [Halobacteriales archaeon QS_8_69_26]